MKIVKAKALRKGDIIGIAAPASPPNSIDDLNKGIRYLEQIGYRIEVGKHVYDKFGYLAGEDKHRADDLNNLISNPKVKAIFIVRGGYGSHRILPMIDYKSLKCNPKIFVGYSDITVIQLAVFKKTGLVTFAGPMLAPDFSKTISESAEELFWRLVSSTKPVGGISKYQNQPFRVIHQGKAEGILLGGNLSIISSLVGTPFIPSFSKSILMLEDIQEAPYRIDRMLHQLKLANK
ncbi:MAG: LD-carboxypeptidase, partial [Bacteroidota bacterium]